MPLKQTRPRQGAKPMVYFKGNLKGLARIQPEALRKRLEKAGAGFHGEGHAKAATYHVIEHTLATAKLLEPGKAEIIGFPTKHGLIPIRIVETKKGQLLIHQMPQTHGITNARPEGTPFDDLKSILSTGFKGIETPNSMMNRDRTRNTGWFIPDIGKLTKNDSYTLEINSPTGLFTERDSQYNMPTRKYPDGHYFIANATPNQVVSVNIALDEKATKEDRTKKKTFYKKEIQKRFGVPVKFI